MFCPAAAPSSVPGRDDLFGGLVRVLFDTTVGEHGEFDLRIFRDDSDLEHLAISVGELRGATDLQPASAKQLSAELLRSMVIGLGLPQLAEVVLLGTARDVAKKAAFAASRSVAAAQLVRRSSLWTLTLGAHANANVAALHRALDG